MIAWFSWYPDHRRRLLLLLLAATLLLAAVAGWYSSLRALALVVGTLAVVLLLGRVELGPVLLVTAAYVVPFEVRLGEIVAANAVLVLLPLLVGLCVMGQMRRRRIQIEYAGSFLPLLALLLLATFAWVWGNINWDPRFPKPPDLLAVQFAQWIIYVLSVLAFVWGAQLSLRSLKQVTWAFIGLGALALLGRYAHLFVRSGFYSLFAARAVSNGNFYVLLTALAGGQALFNREMTRMPRGALLLLALAVPLLGLGGNRDWASSWLPPLLVLLVLCWWRIRSRPVALLVATAALLAAALAFVAADLLIPHGEQMSVAGRRVLWHSILRLSLEQPLFGLGLTAYRHYHHYIPLLMAGGGHWLRPNVNSHNVYIDIFAQMGAAGLLVFLWAMATIALSGWRLKSRFQGNFEAGYVAGAMAGLVGILFASAIVDWLLPFIYNTGFAAFRFSALVWLVLGGLVVLERKAPHKRWEAR